MIEEKLEALTVEIKLLREQLAKGGAAPAAGAKADAGKKPAAAAAAKKPKYSVEQVKAKVLEVKEKHGMERAKTVIADAGADDLASLLTDPKLFDEAYALAETALEEEVEDESGGL